MRVRVRVRVCAGVPLLEGELRPSHHWPAAQASQPCVCSCDLSCTSWSGFCNGKIIKSGGREDSEEVAPQLPLHQALTLKSGQVP